MLEYFTKPSYLIRLVVFGPQLGWLKQLNKQASFIDTSWLVLVRSSSL